jgi:transposase
VPQVVVPDNLKSAVTKPGSTPLIQRTFLDFAVHYDVSIQPARIHRPQDKALVENSVKCAQSWILAKLRHRTFYTLEALNDAIAAMLAKANDRPFQSIEGSRRSRFEALERDTLRPLPPKRYDYAEWVKAKAVPDDYHVPVEQHGYSVPHTLIGKKVEVRLSSTHVEIFCDGAAVALHNRSATKGGHTTLTEHQPNEHRKQAERTPEGFVAWAKTVGPNTLKIVQHQLSIRTPLAGLPACEAMRKLERNHAPADIEAAAARAVKLRVPNPSQVSRFIREPSTRARRNTLPKNQHHANIRGPDYYQGEAR